MQRMGSVWLFLKHSEVLAFLFHQFMISPLIILDSMGLTLRKNNWHSDYYDN